MITSSDLQRVYSVGYNGGAAGLDNSCMCSEDSRYGCAHAEANALVKCGSTDKDKIMFVTLSPCTVCATLMINAGIQKVYYLEDWKDNPGIAMLRAAGVFVQKLYLEV